MFSNKSMLITGIGGIGYVIMEFFLDKVKNLITSSRKQFSEFNRLESVSKNLDHLPLDLTVKDNVIELQGDHKKRVSKHLQSFGIPQSAIRVS